MHRRTLLCCLIFVPSVAAAQPSPEQVEFFEKRIRPVLVESCVNCHGAKKQEAGLRLDSATGMQKGTDTGPVIDSETPEKSSLLRAVRHEGDVAMPPKGKLKAETIADLEAWVKMGAPWPEATNTGVTQTPRSPAEVRKTHWSFQPVKKTAPPTVKNAGWLANDVDRFVLSKLEEKNLTPSPEADRRTLIRRLTFDLTGLPPTPEEVEAFLTDTKPQALERLVDRLLASPQYGERWARHWLDVARYADTKGYVFTAERRFPFAYTYRDYVIRSFNEDLPYDRFLLQQLAADKLDLGDDKRPLAAMGFLTLGRRFLNNVHDIIDDRIDVTMRGLQGLTVACARCHDHKYDPIPTKDYYSLYGVFSNSVEPDQLPEIVPLGGNSANEEYRKELTKLEKDVADYKAKYEKELAARDRKARNERDALQKKVEQLRVTHPGAPASAMVLNDVPNPSDPAILIRGNPRNRGETVRRQYLEVMTDGPRKPFTSGSGRLDLARTIASRDNPLTARVMVNRVWMHHFGHGLVRTPSDFGLRGEAPTHPELLDFLASSFMDNGWSLKKLHRLIVLSSAYRQKSDDRPECVKVDPENRLLWKMNRQRLEFEAMRDSMLAVSGMLDRTAGGPSVPIAEPPYSPRRAIYGFIDRQNLPGLFRTFDLASPDAHTPKRHLTTVPQQALFLMNHPFAQDQARALVARPDVAALTSDEQKIERLYSLLFARRPDAEEIALGRQFVEQAGKDEKLKPWEQYAQVLLLSNEFLFVD